jgi:hypothetical protein
MHKPIHHCGTRVSSALRRYVVLGVTLGTALVASPVAHATSPSFSLDPTSPSLIAIGATAADVLNPTVPPALGPLPPPAVAIPAAALGLVPGDVISSISYGLMAPILPGPGLQVNFSVDAAATGAPFAPPPANVSCEFVGGQSAADVFLAQPLGPPLLFPNVLSLDGNGLADSPCGPPPLPGLGLVEPGPDNLVSLEMCSAATVFAGGVLTAPVYFTLAPGSPGLIAIGATSNDILAVFPPGFAPPIVAVPGLAVGLGPVLPGCGAPLCDEIDAMDLTTGLSPTFSLAPGSPSLSACGLSPGDLMVAGAGAGCGLAISAGALGLLPGDNVDAVAINVDGDADFVADPCDNCPLAPNNDQLDGDLDSVGDACDPCIGSPNADTDGDGICDSSDPCAGFPNVDTDGDAICDSSDPCAGFPNVDADADGVCDSGDPCPLDATDTCCPATPDACTGGFAKGILIKKEEAGKEKLIVKMLQGPLINQTDFGDPLAGGGTKYNLCIYDDAPSLVGEIMVDRAGDANCSGGATTCWKSIGGAPPAGKGYNYKDTDLASNGTGKILLKGGSASAGKSKILVKGKGINIPAGVTAALTATTSVTVQLRGNDAPGAGCWTVTLGSIKKQVTDSFKAK